MRTQIYLHGGLFMEAPENEIYGMRIVPERDETGLTFGGFEGIVISDSLGVLGYGFIEISKMEKTEEGGYHTVSFIKIPPEQVAEHSSTSGKAKAEFLLSEAKKLAKGNEGIAICKPLAYHLALLDVTWDSFQRILAEHKK